MPYKEGFLPLSELSDQDKLISNFYVFEKTNLRVMVISNDSGDGVLLGTLIGFQILKVGEGLNLFPMVRTDEGKEIMPWGFCFPLWPEFVVFLETMDNPESFKQLARLIHGHTGLRKLEDKIKK